MKGSIMAIDNILMMNVVGKTENVDRFAKDIFLFNDIQLVDAMSEIDSGRFILPVTQNNISELLGFSQLMTGESLVDEKLFVSKVEKLNELYDNTLTFEEKLLTKRTYDLNEILSTEKSIEKELIENYTEINNFKARLTEISKSITAYSYLREIDATMEELNNMQHFSHIVGSISKNNANRLKRIYDSVTSLLFHVGDTGTNEEVFIVISPKDFEIETKRVLKALNFKAIEGFDPEYKETPQKVVLQLSREKAKIEQKLKKLNAMLIQNRADNLQEARRVFSVLSVYANLNIIKRFMAFSDENFYCSGWISKQDRKKMECIAQEYPEMIILFNEPDKSNEPPTKLKNNWLFKPFESLVKMYGVPAYNELDPTPFLSITYLVCFGYMFGDVGQGIVLLLAGILTAKKGIELGRVVQRMACSSILFGFLYGSIFGNENLLPQLWIKPFDNINTILYTAVGLGILILLVAYGYSIINKLKVKDIREGVFGKNGIAGFVLYLSILLAAASAYFKSVFTTPMIISAVIMAALVLFREPIANTIQHKKLYDHSAGDYYVEAGFEMFEMLLAMLSNTLSFIRVGAFALTHVGMFLAFETLAHMVGDGVAGIIILIFGNVFIIALEGLIDFIQCLRLQFYELFSKYYSGTGYEFSALRKKKNQMFVGDKI